MVKYHLDIHWRINIVLPNCVTYENSSGRFFIAIDEKAGKIRVFTKHYDDAIPLAVWTFNQLISEMVYNGD